MNLPFATIRPRTDQFDLVLDKHALAPLKRVQTTTVQINVGKLCNQACQHCHVDAGPKRTEIMPRSVVARILELIDNTPGIETIDITGGAPELNPSFRYLVSALKERDLHIIDRCNLTVLFEPGMDDLARFLADSGVHIIASLPCYSQDNVDKQRGKGVFGKSLSALKIFNALGYGQPAGTLKLDLVYNPLGASLPPPQAQLETHYKEELRSQFDIEFNQLLTITNLPISRFAHQLQRSGEYTSYVELLTANFNPNTVSSLMCRSLVSIGYDGHIYDCDFNQMLALEIPTEQNDRATTVWNITTFAALNERQIATASHCLGCTAGAGSSCGGALS